MSWPRRLLAALAWSLAAIVLIALFVSAFVAGSVWVDGFGSADRLAGVSNTTIPGSDAPIPAYVATPGTPGHHPAVIMLHEFWGLNPDVVSRADLLAREEGYVVVAPNLFRDQVTNYTPRGVFQVLSTSQAQVNRDLDDVVAWTRARQDVDPQRVGMVGFCYGGRCALLYGLHNPSLQAAVDFYGLPMSDARRLSRLNAPLLGIYAGSDSALAPGQVQQFTSALQSAGVEATVTVYEGQGHAFMHGADQIQGPGPQAIAWREMRTFLDAKLSAEPSSVATEAAALPAEDYYGLMPALRLGVAHTGHGHPWTH